MTSGGHSESTHPSGGVAKRPSASGAPGPAGMAASSFTGLFDFEAILAVADVLPVMVAYLDRDLIFRFVNRPFADWYEQDRALLLGQKIADVMTPATFADRQPRFEAALLGERQRFVAGFDHPSRGALMVRADYAPYRRGGDGVVDGVVMIVEDVTEQAATERALRETESRFHRIADHAPIMMWVSRADRSRDFVNRAYSEFFGLTPEQCGQVDWADLIHPDEREAILAEFVAQMERPGDLPVELVARYQRQDGEWRWLRSVSVPRRGPSGELEGFIGAATDITLGKQSEQALQRLVDEQTADLITIQDQLRQAQKMEALGQLTGGIAHDFNNLLTVIVGGLDMIAKRTSDERTLHYATNALTAAERGARLTAQLLAFSRVQRLEVRPVYISPMVEEMRPLLRNVLGPGVSKEIDLDPHLMPVMADPTQVEVAVLNLAINARDAMPDGGTLTVRSRRIKSRGDPELADGDYVELSISDTGVGMDEEVVARAFEPFFTTKDVGKGTGLGLSMVYGMARQSGGTARIVSRPGHGTTVSLYFRRADKDGVVPASGGKTGDELRRETGHYSVLLIDDDDDVRGFVAEGLEEFGHDVTVASDGKTGLALFAERKPDVVILDFLMPGMSGADVAERIRRTVPDQPILFMSGYSETDAIRRAAPDAPLLPKPFRPAALEEALTHLMQERATPRGD